MPRSFSGFTKQALAFFRQLARNNKREPSRTAATTRDGYRPARGAGGSLRNPDVRR
jgi:hypothetical protein